MLLPMSAGMYAPPTSELIVCMDVHGWPLGALPPTLAPFWYRTKASGVPT